jgi:hypothetical protein
MVTRTSSRSLSISATIVASALLASALVATSATSADAATGSVIAGKTATDAAAASTTLLHGNLAGWTQNFKDDFSTPVAKGGFPGPYAKQWMTYDGFGDTWKIGRYESDILSAHDGVLDMHLHTGSDGVPRAAAPIPMMNGQWGGQTYGRYSVRMKADPLPGYGTAFLLWDDDNVWENGEINFPEGSLDGSTQAFNHKLGEPWITEMGVDTKTSYTGWHTYTIDWTPKKITYLLDGVVVASTTTNIPKTPMHWVLQTATNGTKPAANVQGHLLIDWVSQYAYTPGSAATVTLPTKPPVAAKPLTLTAPAPQIQGTPTVGATLTARTGTWTSGTALSYKWLREGAAIAGATGSSYRTTAVDASKRISLVVTGFKTGYTTAAKTSAAVVVKPAPLTSAAPTVTGKPTVGGKVGAKTGTWTTGTTFTYQWKRNGQAISRATASTYAPTASDANRAITVVVTGTKPGHTAVARTSNAATVKPLTLTTGTPGVKGSTKAGSLLTGQRGTWTAGTSWKFQWTRDGSWIKGATGTTYRTKASDAGHKIGVKVTGSKPGYTSASRWSKPVTIRR